MTEITNDCQRIVVYKINPNQQELEGSVTFDRNVDGRIFYGRIFIANNAIIIKNEEKEVIGIFSLEQFCALNKSN